MESGGIGSRILNLNRRWKWVVNFTAQPLFLPGKGPPIPTGREDWVGTRTCVCLGRKSNTDSLVMQPVACIVTIVIELLIVYHCWWMRYLLFEIFNLFNFPTLTPPISVPSLEGLWEGIFLPSCGARGWKKTAFDLQIVGTWDSRDGKMASSLFCIKKQTHLSRTLGQHQKEGETVSINRKLKHRTQL